MFDFFKRKKETPVCEVSPYEQLLDDIYIIEQSKKTEFDPYDRNNLIERKEISRLKIQRFEKFFSEFNEESFAAALPANYLWPASECWEHITDTFELSKEELAWDIDVERIMDQIMVLSVDGVLQSDLKKKIPDANPQHITRICKRFEADKLIKREKRGSTYYITR